MADLPFNIAKGRAVEFHNRVDSNDPANAAFIVVLLQVAEADATLIDYADLATLLAAAGNTEATFTNYVRKTVTDADITFPAPDNVNDRYDIDIPDQVWTTAGGAVNNDLVKVLVCYDTDTTGGTDSDIIPVSHHDFVITTNGGNITALIDAAGFYRAS